MHKGYFERADTRSVVEWFEKGGTLQFDDSGPSNADYVTSSASPRWTTNTPMSAPSPYWGRT
mgnify:CR=1 FL=1